jgi:hypothetical protein
VTKKFITYMVASIVSYILFAGSIIQFYKDDPAHMDLTDRQEFNLRYVATLKVENKTQRGDVIYYLGSPDITEAKEVEDAIYQVMFYRTRKIRGDGITTKDECTPMLFINGLLIAWGKDAYSQYNAY